MLAFQQWDLIEAKNYCAYFWKKSDFSSLLKLTRHFHRHKDSFAIPFGVCFQFTFPPKPTFLYRWVSGYQQTLGTRGIIHTTTNPHAQQWIKKCLQVTPHLRLWAKVHTWSVCVFYETHTHTHCCPFFFSFFLFWVNLC